MRITILKKYIYFFKEKRKKEDFFCHKNTREKRGLGSGEG